MRIAEIALRISLFLFFIGLVLAYAQTKGYLTALPENFAYALFLIGMVAVIFVNVDSICEVIMWIIGALK